LPDYQVIINSETLVINNETANGNFGNHNIYNGFNEFAFETMKKYIAKLEEENAQLKEHLK
jgi:hypothetical protein